MPTTIAITGGGTGGHVFPGLAVLDELKLKGIQRVVWIGSKQGLERDIIVKQGIPFFGIPSGKLRRYLSLKNLVDLFKICFGFLASLIILAREKPGVLFSKGGFVSVPPVFAARVLKIPIVTHESDVCPGLATRINAKSAGKICHSFPESKRYFKASLQSRLLLTGNPVRPAIRRGNAERGRKSVGCEPNLPLILVMGGSLGSRALNHLVHSILEPLSGRCFIVHQMGPENYVQLSHPNYHGVPFLHDSLGDVLAAADLVLTRSGANMLFELAAAGKPAVLIPLPKSASRGEQLENARVFATRGAAVVMEQEQCSPDQLLQVVLNLIDNTGILGRMSAASRQLDHPDAAGDIASLLVERISGSWN